MKTYAIYVPIDIGIMFSVKAEDESEAEDKAIELWEDGTVRSWARKYMASPYCDFGLDSVDFKILTEGEYDKNTLDYFKGMLQ